MLKNYFKIAYRNLLKNKVYSMVNIFGLAIGIAACFFIFQYVHFELSYDRFNKNAGNLYRITVSYSGSFSDLPMTATNHPAVGPAIAREFPEVVNYARLVDPSLFISSSAISYTDKTGNLYTFTDGKMYIADSSFFTMFSYPLLEGNPATVLSQPGSIVISKTEAEKYFGKEEPVGKTVFLNQKMPFKVTGVFKDIPENSHLKFDKLISFKTIDNGGLSDNWTWPEYYNYVLLAPGTDPDKVAAKLPAFINRHLSETMKLYNFGCAFHLQPVTDIHLKSNYLKEPEINGSEKEVSFLSIIGIFILAIAWINYINLSTAKSTERAKEVGLRKVVGSTRIQLIGQFMMESFIINLFALVIATIIVLCCFPFFGPFTGRNINGSSSAVLWHSSGFWLILLGIFLTGAFLVGAYPAFVLSGFKPVLVLKGKFNSSVKGIVLRKALVSLQFILSIILIGGTLTVYRQLSFMRNQALGYNKDQVLVIKGPAIFDSLYLNKINLFKLQLAGSPSVNDVTVSSDIPGKTIIERNSVRKANEDQTHNYIAYLMQVDDHFVPTFQVEMAAGRNFRHEETMQWGKTDSVITKAIVNESLVKAMGFKNNEEALHQQIFFQYSPNPIRCEIIGVLKNYHQRSLREAYDPILYFYTKNNGNGAYFSINIKTQHIHQMLASMENAYKNIFPGSPFGYFFLNDYFNSQYKGEQEFGKVFGLFTVLAIFIACLGLLGLSSFVIKMRTKEIGIRKVLGASVYSILVLFSRDFVKLVCIATAITIPITYFTANRWLNNYAFHIQLNWLIFVLPPSLLLAICLIIISLQSTKAALTNPVDSLKTE